MGVAQKTQVLNLKLRWQKRLRISDPKSIVVYVSGLNSWIVLALGVATTPYFRPEKYSWICFGSELLNWPCVCNLHVATTPYFRPEKYSRVCFGPEHLITQVAHARMIQEFKPETYATIGLVSASGASDSELVSSTLQPPISNVFKCCHRAAHRWTTPQFRPEKYSCIRLGSEILNLNRFSGLALGLH